MSARRLLSAWSMVALCALALAVVSAISGTVTNDHVTMGATGWRTSPHGGILVVVGNDRVAE